MISSLELKIALRYLRPKKKEGFLKIISVFSFGGIALGVSVLIIVMSVMGGFRTELINKIKTINNDIVLMQCNTNYTASAENFKYIHLNVLKSYAKLFPDVILGLSDHTLGHTTVLGAVALGAKVIEKHFKDLINDIYI